MNKHEWEAYYLQNYKALLLFALSLTQNREDAEDLVSEAFIKASLSFEKGNFKAWIYTVIRNEFYNLYKKRKRYADVEENQLEWIQAPDDILRDIIEQEERRWLFTKIYELPQKERQIMLLSVDKGLNDEAIAAISGQSISNVRVIKHRVKQKLIKLHEKEW